MAFGKCAIKKYISVIFSVAPMGVTDTTHVLHGIVLPLSKESLLAFLHSPGAEGASEEPRKHHLCVFLEHLFGNSCLHHRLGCQCPEPWLQLLCLFLLVLLAE